jgi:hypothetical protein
MKRYKIPVHLKKAKWFKKIPATYRKHLIMVAEKTTLKAFKEMRAFQIREKILCFECNMIAEAIGVE